MLDKLMSPDSGADVPAGTSGVESAPVAGETSTQPVEQPAQEDAQEKAFAKRLEQERSKLLEKYGDYDAVKGGLSKAAKIAGYSSVPEFLSAVEQAEKAEEQKRLQEAGIQDPEVVNDLISRHPAVQAAMATEAARKSQEEIQELAQDFQDAFGRKITNEDVTQEVLDYRAKTGVTLSEAYFFVNRKNLKTLMDKEKAAAAEQVRKDFDRQAKRGVESSSDSPVTTQELDFTADEKAWAEARVSKGMYKDLNDAWKWLRKKN